MNKLNILLIFIMGATNLYAFADTPPLTTGSTPTVTTDNTSTTTTSKMQPFKLSASKVEISLDQLNDVGLDLKHVLTLCRHLYDEVMIRPMDVITEPEMIGTGVVINLPVALEPTGPPKPPRKERVDLIMSEMRPVITLLVKNGDQFLKDSQLANFPDSMQEKLDPLIKKWTAYADDVYAKLLKLEALTPGPTYDNYAIADNAKAIEQDIQHIDEMRRPIFKLVQEEGKRLMAEQNNQQ